MGDGRLDSCAVCAYAGPAAVGAVAGNDADGDVEGTPVAAAVAAAAALGGGLVENVGGIQDGWGGEDGD